MNLPKQDKSGVRTPTDIERKYKFKVLEEVGDYGEEITELKQNKVDKVAGKNLSTNDFTNGYKTQVDENTQARHTHNNQAVLDTYTKTEAELESELNTATENAHTHDNKALLDSYTQSNTNLTNAVNNTHTHSNKSLLDSYTNSNSNISNAISNSHTHSNKSVLDKITQSMLDAIGSGGGIDILSYNASDYNGYLWLSNGHLVQWGNVTISPTSANTVTNTTITFPMTYDYAPSISAVPQVAYPNIVTCSVGAGSTLTIAKRSMVIYMTRTNTSATTFRWVAEGYKAP